MISTINSASDNINIEFHAAVLENDLMPKHFHKNYEIIIAVEGNCDCLTNDKKYRISAGEAFFICPLQMHEIKPGKNSIIWRVNFNDNIILTVSQSIDGRIPKKPNFKLNKNTLSYSIKLLEDTFGKDSTRLERIVPFENRMRIKGMLYIVLADFLDSATLISTPKTDTVAAEIALYISNNYKNNISLKDIAKEKGYAYQYLSRTFNKHMGMNFKHMLNHYRAQCAFAMLQDTNLPVSYVGFECGFQSIRSFNQVCRDIFGMTPKEIRELRYI